MPNRYDDLSREKFATAGLTKLRRLLCVLCETFAYSVFKYFLNTKDTIIRHKCHKDITSGYSNLTETIFDTPGSCIVTP